MTSSRNAIVVLAAGSSTRMGSPKQLLQFQGKPLLLHAVETAAAASCEAVVVVLGANADAVRTALNGIESAPGRVRIVDNLHWQQGMGTSIQAGLRVVQELGLDGAILMLADQPLISPAILNQLISEHQRTAMPVVASSYSGTVGVPVYFAKSHFPQLLALPADQGCKGVILRNGHASLLIDCPEAQFDIDTPSDYQKVVGQAASLRGTASPASLVGEPVNRDPDIEPRGRVDRP